MPYQSQNGLSPSSMMLFAQLNMPFQSKIFPKNALASSSITIIVCTGAGFGVGGGGGGGGGSHGSGIIGSIGSVDVLLDGASILSKKGISRYEGSSLAVTYPGSASNSSRLKSVSKGADGTGKVSSSDSRELDVAVATEKAGNSRLKQRRSVANTLLFKFVISQHYSATFLLIKLLLVFV